MDLGSACKPEFVRRHGQGRVVPEQRGKSLDVVPFESGDEALEHTSVPEQLWAPGWQNADVSV